MSGSERPPTLQVAGEEKGCVSPPPCGRVLLDLCFRPVCYSMTCFNFLAFARLKRFLSKTKSLIKVPHEAPAQTHESRLSRVSGTPGGLERTSANPAAPSSSGPGPRGPAPGSRVQQLEEEMRWLKKEKDSLLLQVLALREAETERDLLQSQVGQLTLDLQRLRMELAAAHDDARRARQAEQAKAEAERELGQTRRLILSLEQQLRRAREEAAELAGRLQEAERVRPPVAPDLWSELEATLARIEAGGPCPPQLQGLSYRLAQVLGLDPLGGSHASGEEGGAVVSPSKVRPRCTVRMALPRAAPETPDPLRPCRRRRSLGPRLLGHWTAPRPCGC